MADALKKIRTRAKQLQKKKPGAKWTNLIKEASQEYRTGKLGASATRQTGSSNKKKDSKRKAKKPGKRKSASGKTYYERRKNRSDKPGGMTGIINDVTRARNQYDRLKQDLKDATKAYKAATGINKVYAKVKMDRLKYEVRERKYVLTALSREMKKK